MVLGAHRTRDRTVLRAKNERSAYDRARTVQGAKCLAMVPGAHDKTTRLRRTKHDA
jgi:hypothetical protein